MTRVTRTCHACASSQFHLALRASALVNAGCRREVASILVPTGRDAGGGSTYETVRKERALYRNKLSEVRKRIAFIKKMLRGKELHAL